MRSKSFNRVGLLVALVLVAIGVYVVLVNVLPSNGRRGRSEPICAVHDCATGAVDDGCSDDGRCLSCVNMCPPPPPSMH